MGIPVNQLIWLNLLAKANSVRFRSDLQKPAVNIGDRMILGHDAYGMDKARFALQYFQGIQNRGRVNWAIRK